MKKPHGLANFEVLRLAMDDLVPEFPQLLAINPH
jgi:hypothetical protein